MAPPDWKFTVAFTASAAFASGRWPVSRWGSRVGSTPAVSLSLPEALWFTAAEMLRLSSTEATALPLVRHKGVLSQL